MKYIRNFKIEDANEMLLWMHDNDINRCFEKKFIDKTIDDSKAFILNANNEFDDIANAKNLHFAICDEDNKYCGTISLKDIDYTNKCAEFAIVTIKRVHGTGLSKLAFDEMKEYACDVLKLDYIYFSCLKDNFVANKFYHKNNARLISFDDLGNIANYNNIKNDDKLYWYICYLRYL